LDQERRLLLAQLAMWAAVNSQGINPDTVNTIGFSEARNYDRLDGTKYFNYVRLKNDSTVFLNPPILRPEFNQL
jgi:hypothetical protein